MLSPCGGVADSGPLLLQKASYVPQKPTPTGRIYTAGSAHQDAALTHHLLFHRVSSASRAPSAGALFWAAITRYLTSTAARYFSIIGEKEIVTFYLLSLLEAAPVAACGAATFGSLFRKTMLTAMTCWSLPQCCTD